MVKLFFLIMSRNLFEFHTGLSYRGIELKDFLIFQFHTTGANLEKLENFKFTLFFHTSGMILYFFCNKKK